MIKLFIEDLIEMEGESKFYLLTELCSPKNSYNIFKWKNTKDKS